MLGDVGNRNRRTPAFKLASDWSPASETMRGSECLLTSLDTECVFVCVCVCVWGGVGREMNKIGFDSWLTLSLRCAQNQTSC